MNSQSPTDSHPNPAAATRKAENRARLQRWLVVVLVAAALVLWVVAYLRPWWQFYLFAPQYPNGLVLDISLTGLGGDAKEINMLNHYIGMKGLDEAASFERQWAVWGVALVGLMSAAFALIAGRKWSWLLIVPGFLFPAGFVADSVWWLYHFGHTLDRHAPLNIPMFTPQFLGWGKIGQFETYAMPLIGFWLAIAALGSMTLAMIVRYRLCRTCPLHDSCGATCPKKLVLGNVPYRVN